VIRCPTAEGDDIIARWIALHPQDEHVVISSDTDFVQSKVGPVFLYDISQLSKDEFRKDLQIFLGLADDMPLLPNINTSGPFDHIASGKLQSNARLINICNPEHDAIRLALMEKAMRASVWI
jgi:hypothetical protein